MTRRAKGGWEIPLWRANLNFRLLEAAAAAVLVLLSKLQYLWEKWVSVKGDVHMLATLGAIKALFPAPFTARL